MPLLAHLISHFRDKPEDIATYSLQYIISESSELNDSFTSFITGLINEEINSKLNYMCQSVGEKRERPDIAGINEDGNEIVLCEAKFYAGLTDNQPNAYIDRLIQKNGVGLIFICPDCRKQSLWWQLNKLVLGRSVYSISDHCVSIDGIKMAITTWNEILTELRRSSASSAKDYLFDIDQLDCFCKQMDSEAFIPFTLEELGTETPKKEERFFIIIDELIDRLLSDKTLKARTKKNSGRSSFRKGYSYNIIVSGYSLTINYDRDCWMNSDTSDTPFWVAIKSLDEKQDEDLKHLFKRVPQKDKCIAYKQVYLALHPLTNATLDEVVIDMKTQLTRYINGADKIKDRQCEL